MRQSCLSHRDSNSDAEGRAEIAREFNAAVRDGRLKGSVVISVSVTFITLCAPSAPSSVSLLSSSDNCIFDVMLLTVDFTSRMYHSATITM